MSQELTPKEKVEALIAADPACEVILYRNGHICRGVVTPEALFYYALPEEEVKAL